MKAMVVASLAATLASPSPRDAQDATAPARTLEAGQAVVGTLAAGEAHRYRIELAAGDFVRVAVQPRGFGVVATLSRPDGSALFDADVAGDTAGAETLMAIATAGGSYSMGVRALEKSPGPGEYRLVVEALRPASAPEKELIEADGLFAEAERAQQAGTAASMALAVDRLRKAQAIWHANGSRWREAGVLWSLASIHDALSQNDAALEDVRELLALADGLGVAAGRLRGRALSLKGWLQYSRGEPAAFETLQEAMRLWTRYDDPQTESDTSNYLAILYRERGEERKALDHYLRSLALRRAAGDTQREAMSLHNVGVFYADLKELGRAREYLEQALALNRASKESRGQAASLLELGLVYADLGEIPKAIETAIEAVRLTHEMGNRRWESRALVRAGRVYDAAGQRETAAEHFRRALELSRAIPDRQGEGDALRAIGRSELAAGRAEPAREAFREALSIAQASGERSRITRILNELAGAERAAGELTAARQHNEAALALTEAMRGTLPNHQLKGSMLAWAQGFYDLHVDLLMRTQGPERDAALVAALETNERSRARSFLELLAESERETIGCAGSGKPGLAERDRELERRLDAAVERQVRSRPGAGEDGAALSREYQDLTREHDLVEAEMRAGCASSAAVLQAQPLSLAEIRDQVLDDRTTLLEYHLGSERSYLWAASREGVESYELPKASEIETVARRWHDLLSAGAAAGDEARLHAASLSAMLIAPAADRLRGRRLLVVADGALQYLPFGALPSPGSPATPLVVDHEIVSAPSASFVAVLRRRLAGRAPAAKTLAVLADPVFDAADERVATRGSKAPAVARVAAVEAADLTRAASDVGLRGGAISRLPFTRREAMAILSLVPEKERMAALDFSASRHAAASPELGGYRYVHFATHGFVDSAHPELSGIVLSLVDANGREQSGFLPASQVFSLKLPAELVVLSGCRTALGKEIKGEGLLGLTRAFMSAGAGRVIASLWKVDDAATAELMKTMYERILRDGERPAQALRSAQIAMSRTRRWSAPYYWAAFVIQGEWN